MKHLCLPMAILLTGLAVPVLAADPTDQPMPSESTIKGTPFTEENARAHLMRQGYTNISALVKDESGKWVGTATKDGKTVPVAVDVNRQTTE